MVVAGQNILVFRNSKGILCSLGGRVGTDCRVSVGVEKRVSRLKGKIIKEAALVTVVFVL